MHNPQDSINFKLSLRQVLMNRPLFVLFSLALFSCNAPEKAPEGPPTTHSPKAPAVEKQDTEKKAEGPQTDVEKVLESLDKTLVFHENRAKKTKSWLSWNNVAGHYLGRARMTGDVKSFVKAGQAIDEAFKIAKKGAGPFLTRASYNLAIHQISAVEADLVAFEKKIVIKKGERAKVAALRGAVYFLSGDLDHALEKFKKAESLKPATSSAARLANYYLKTGEFELAKKWYKTAIDRVDKADKSTHAWAELHLGIVSLEENDLDEAEKHYAIANDLFKGWYLVNEHIAEAAARTGHYQAAIERYEHILEDTPSGEFYQALGDTYLASAGEPGMSGNHAKAEEAYKKARIAFERDIAILPSAASGHALNFYLEHAVERALVLAKENFKLRPGHESRTQLAKALMLNGKRAEAEKILEPTLASKWATNNYLVVAAVLFEKTKPKVAKTLKEKAEKTHPGVVASFRDSLPKP